MRTRMSLLKPSKDGRNHKRSKPSKTRGSTLCGWEMTACGDEQEEEQENNATSNKTLMTHKFNKAKLLNDKCNGQMVRGQWF